MASKRKFTKNSHLLQPSVKNFFLECPKTFSTSTAANQNSNPETDADFNKMRLELHLDTVKKGWFTIIKPELGKPYFSDILRAIQKDRALVCPPPEAIFNCLTYFEPEDTKVVIIGQDPYHTPGVAMGLAFSVHHKAKLPPSLKNIYKEVKECYPETVFKDGCLMHWAEQGVLLLNTTLTALQGKPKSHSEIGWLNVTKAIMRGLHAHQNIVYVLWGAHAQSLKPLIKTENNLVLSCGHPSPFSVKYFTGNKHFLKANKYLKEHGKREIKW